MAYTKFITKIEKMAAVAEELLQELTDLNDEMQELYDGRSEKWQEGEKGVAFESALDAVAAALDAASQVGDNLSDATSELEV